MPLFEQQGQVSVELMFGSGLYADDRFVILHRHNVDDTQKVSSSIGYRYPFLYYFAPVALFLKVFEGLLRV